MTINDIYELSLYLAEKTDDNTGFIESEYKKQHQKKAEIIIRKTIRKYVNLMDETMPDIDLFGADDDIPLPLYVLKNIIPLYVAAMLSLYDKETDKYNTLIYEYQSELNKLKCDEDEVDMTFALSGMEG